MENKSNIYNLLYEIKSTITDQNKTYQAQIYLSRLGAIKSDVRLAGRDSEVYQIFVFCIIFIAYAWGLPNKILKYADDVDYFSSITTVLTTREMFETSWRVAVAYSSHGNRTKSAQFMALAMTYFPAIKHELENAQIFEQMQTNAKQGLLLFE
jgi:hypothetical protein